jgi:hypothetical protein
LKTMMKALCIGAVATAAAFGTVGTAVAAPVAHHVPAKVSGTIDSRDGSVTPAVDPVVFNCSYVSVVPFQALQFTCTVTSGRLQLFLSCTNGSKVYSPIMPAVGTYTPLLACPAGTQFTLINWQAV